MYLEIEHFESIKKSIYCILRFNFLACSSNRLPLDNHPIRLNSVDKVPFAFMYISSSESGPEHWVSCDWSMDRYDSLAHNVVWWVLLVVDFGRVFELFVYFPVFHFSFYPCNLYNIGKFFLFFPFSTRAILFLHFFSLVCVG